MRYGVLVEVRHLPGVADPQGATVERALPMLGFDEVQGVTIGKAIRFTIDAPDESTARQRVDDLCQRFLTNPVIERSVVTLTAEDPAGTAAGAADHAADQGVPR